MATTSITNQPVKAGFPNAAHDAPQYNLDLHDLLVQHPASTFFMRVDGNYLVDMGIYHQDIVIIDKSSPVASGSLVAAYIDGQFVIRRYQRQGGQQYLVVPRAEPSSQARIAADSVHIWGVVTHTIHNHLVL